MQVVEARRLVAQGRQSRGVVADLRSGRVVSHPIAWVRTEDVDPAPLGASRDAPVWLADDPSTAAYLRVCAANPGDPIDPRYLAAIEVAAGEAHAFVEMGGVDAAHVLGRQMQQRDAVTAENAFIVDVFVAQVDDRADAVLAGQALRLL